MALDCSPELKRLEVNCFKGDDCGLKILLSFLALEAILFTGVEPVQQFW